MEIRNAKPKSMKQLQKALLKKREALSKWYSEMNTISDLLQGNCDHSKTEEFKWEHDNGYGRQTAMKGNRCCYCGWKDLWNNGRFSDPKNLND